MAYDTAIVLGLGFSSFILAYLSTKISGEKHGFLQFFFMSMSLLFMTFGGWVLMEIARISAHSELETTLGYFYLTNGIITLFFIGYSFILFFEAIWNWISARRKKGR